MKMTNIGISHFFLTKIKIEVGQGQIYKSFSQVTALDIYNFDPLSIPLSRSLIFQFCLRFFFFICLFNFLRFSKGVLSRYEGMWQWKKATDQMPLAAALVDLGCRRSSISASACPQNHTPHTTMSHAIY